MIYHGCVEKTMAPIGVRDQFRMGGGGGLMRSVIFFFCSNILSIALPKIKWFLPEYYMIFFLPENGYLKKL